MWCILRRSCLFLDCQLYNHVGGNTYVLVQIAEVALPDGSVCICGVVQHEANAFVSVLGSKVHTAPFRLVPVTSDSARLRAVHLPDHVPVAGETLEVIVQASDASGAVLDMEDMKVVAEMVLKSDRGALRLPLHCFTEHVILSVSNQPMRHAEHLHASAILMGVYCHAPSHEWHSCTMTSFPECLLHMKNMRYLGLLKHEHVRGMKFYCAVGVGSLSHRCMAVCVKIR